MPRIIEGGSPPFEGPCAFKPDSKEIESDFCKAMSADARLRSRCEGCLSPYRWCKGHVAMRKFRPVARPPKGDGLCEECRTTPKPVVVPVRVVRPVFTPVPTTPKPVVKVAPAPVVKIEKQAERARKSQLKAELKQTQDARRHLNRLSKRLESAIRQRLQSKKLQKLSVRMEKLLVLSRYHLRLDRARKRLNRFTSRFGVKTRRKLGKLTARLEAFKPQPQEPQSELSLWAYRLAVVEDVIRNMRLYEPNELITLPNIAARAGSRLDMRKETFYQSAAFNLSIEQCDELGIMRGGPMIREAKRAREPALSVPLSTENAPTVRGRELLQRIDQVDEVLKKKPPKEAASDIKRPLGEIYQMQGCADLSAEIREIIVQKNMALGTAYAISRLPKAVQLVVATALRDGKTNSSRISIVPWKVKARSFSTLRVILEEEGVKWPEGVDENGELLPTRATSAGDTI